jgi:hypothetical protein
LCAPSIGGMGASQHNEAFNSAVTLGEKQNLMWLQLA